MATEELEITISPSGEVSVQARGFSGSTCLSATAGLERALGGQVVERQMTDEAYARTEVQEQQHLGRFGRREW